MVAMKNNKLQKRMDQIAQVLGELYPNPSCALNFSCPLELLIATILSAQCTDKRVNEVSQTLFKKYRTVEDYANVSQEEFEEDIRSTGFYHNKAKNIRACCTEIISRFGGEVPDNLEDLESLPGVGHKTANVVLTNAFGISSGIPVDTHVIRLSNRWELVDTKDPLKIEAVLKELIPQENWTDVGHQIILQGRAVCSARKPDCENCPMSGFCPKKL